MSEEVKSKRPYVKRAGEFNDMTVEQVQQKIDEVTTQIKEYTTQIKADPNNTTAVTAKKEATNTLTRAYKRLRALGYNSREENKKNKETNG